MFRVGVLGRLMVVAGDREIDIATPMHRRLLALLAAQPNSVLPTGFLIDELWHGDPPRTARKTLAVYVHRLRRLLDAERRIVQAPGGYRIELETAELDLLLFEHLAEQARTAGSGGDLDRASAHTREALALWRGPAFADVDDLRSLGAVIERLTQARLALLEDRLQLELDRGRSAEIIDELIAVTSEHPYRERARELLMLAYYRSGQRAGALDAYRRTYECFRDELGIEPGPGLQALHRQILDGDPALAVTGPAGAVAPRMLPRDLPDFVGRTEDLRWLDDLAESPGGIGIINALSGTGGVGKTALAVRWAHRAAGRFTQGQLYVDLRGYHAQTPMQPAEALSNLLVALGIAPERIPIDVDQAAALYRSLLADKRMLILLDNARTAEQVRLLLPGAPDCLVLITSRDRLAGLIARNGARLRELGTLPPAEAVQLLCQIVGEERIKAEPDAAGELAAACGYLPLALRIAAARLTAQQDRSIAAFVADIRAGDRIAMLEIEDDPGSALRAVFDQSYGALSNAERRLFRLLGLLPGVDAELPAIASLAGGDVVVPLRGLVEANLLTEAFAGRYSLHDLLKDYALDRAQAEDAVADRDAALKRLLDRQLRMARSAAARLTPGVARLPLPGLTNEFSDYADAMAWMHAEHANLVASVHFAARHGPAKKAWQLADAMRGYFWICRRIHDWMGTANAGLEAAIERGEDAAQAAMHLSLGMGYRSINQVPQSVEQFKAAQSAARAAGWTEGRIAAASGLGVAYSEAGQAREALQYMKEALELNRRIDRVVGVAVNLTNLGVLRANLGELRQSVDDLTEAIAILRQVSDLRTAGFALTNLSYATTQLGDLGLAESYAEQACKQFRVIADPSGEMVASIQLAEVLHRRGKVLAAREHATAAETATAKTSDRRQQVMALVVLTRIERDQRNFAEAASLAGRALAVSEEIDHHVMRADCLDELAQVLKASGECSQALPLALRAIAICDERGYLGLKTKALTTAAEIHDRLGNLASARDAAKEALTLSERTGYQATMDRILAILTRAC